MTALDKELEQLNSDIYTDVLNLIDKYVNITSLDIPENDEDDAKQRIVAIMKKVIDEVQDKA
jgi:hypothetical protein